MRFRVSSIAPGLALCSTAILYFSGCATSTPPVAPAGREIRPRVGLALGGGGARGFAEIGVLRVLEQEKIPIDLVVGTSVGSLIGAFYADTGRVLDAEFLAVAVEEEDIFDFKAFAFFSGGWVKGDRLEQFLEDRLRHKTIESFTVPYAAVATDLRTGETVVLDQGAVAPAVHASCAIPGVFVPVTIGDATYVDGGVTDPTPADVARRKGADIVIAVSIPAGLPPKAPKNAIEVAVQTVSIMSVEIARLRAREADIVIAPDVGAVGYRDFSQKKLLIEAGEAAARAALPRIRALIAAQTRREPLTSPTAGR